MNSAVEMHAFDAHWSCASWKQIFCLVWRGDITVARARIATTAFDTFAAKSDRKLVCLTIIEPAAAPPDPNIRPVFAQILRKAENRIAGVANVVPAAGFKGAMVRGAITGLSLLAREPYPLQVFSALGEALEWIGKCLYGQTLPAGFLDDAEIVVKSLREGYPRT